MMPTGCPCSRAVPVTTDLPYSALNSVKVPPSTSRTITSCTSYGIRGSVGTTSYSVPGSRSGAIASTTGQGDSALGARVDTIRRTMRSASLSSAARWSVTPEVRECRSPPPSSSAVTTSPVAAFTSGGPPRKMVPCLRTMTASSLIAGTYAPPAVQLPSTAAICGIPLALMVAWL
ncbi:Uncharacterised protein [Mycobacteroides abscessus subsp. massiliense]|nr:Uncharacterised protein [Mycobacteroides abscessus subsp. massiliense]